MTQLIEIDPVLDVFLQYSDSKHQSEVTCNESLINGGIDTGIDLAKILNTKQNP